MAPEIPGTRTHFLVQCHYVSFWAISVSLVPKLTADVRKERVEYPRFRLEAICIMPIFWWGDKVFAFIQGDGVALKLPKDKIQALVEARQAEPLVMGKRTMKEWVVIRHEKPEQYQQDEALFKAAIAFVASKA
jgi:hypothetical protein